MLRRLQDLQRVPLTQPEPEDTPWEQQAQGPEAPSGTGTRTRLTPFPERALRFSVTIHPLWPGGQDGPG